MKSVENTPAYLKLDLYCKGIRLAPDCFPTHYQGRAITRTRAGLGSGLELVLPGNLWTNVPVVESFAEDSPYELIREGDRFFVTHPERPRVEVRLSPRPDWYSARTSSGKRMDRVGTLQGTYLGIYPTAVCEYWTESPKVNCRFCSVGLNLGAGEDGEKTVEDVLEVVHAARRESGITYVDFNTGHYTGETYLDQLEPIIRRVKAETDLFVGVQTPPHSDLSRYDDLQRMGVNRVSFCFELFDQGCFEEICPGKNREYGLERYLQAVEYCAGLRKNMTWRNPWVVNGELVAGLEPPESSIAAIDWLTARGAVPTVCVFRPLIGTELENHPVPKTEEMLPVFTHLYRACMRHDLPIGLAPNIHVSLIMLPEECRELAEGSEWTSTAERRRRLTAKAFAAQYYTRRIWRDWRSVRTG